MTIGPLQNPIKWMQIFHKSGEITLKKKLKSIQFFKSKEGRKQGWWSRQTGWPLLNCLEVSGRHQRSGIHVLVSSHADGILSQRQVLHANTLHTGVTLSSVLSVSPCHTPLQAKYRQQPPACSTPPSLSPLPLFSSLPSSSFKGTVHWFVIFFYIFFLIHSIVSFKIM